MSNFQYFLIRNWSRCQYSPTDRYPMIIRKGKKYQQTKSEIFECCRIFPLNVSLSRISFEYISSFKLRKYCSTAYIVFFPTIFSNSHRPCLNRSMLWMAREFRERFLVFRKLGLIWKKKNLLLILQHSKFNQICRGEKRMDLKASAAFPCYLGRFRFNRE